MPLPHTTCITNTTMVFKKGYGERTEKWIDYWFFGQTEVRSIVEPVTL